MIMRLSAAVAAGLLAATAAHAGGTTEPAPVAPVTVAPAPTAYDWSGAYGGLSFASVDPRASSTVGAADNEPFDEDMAFGVFGGYLFQSGSLVYGGELGYTSYEGEFVNFPGFLIEDIIEIRGRVGYAAGRALISASVGYAMQHYVDPGSAGIDMDGLTYGLGVDYAVTDRVFVGLEYVVRDIEGTDPVSGQLGVEDESVRLRIGLRF